MTERLDIDMIKHIYICNLCGTEYSATDNIYRIKFNYPNFSLVPPTEQSASERIICKSCIETIRKTAPLPQLVNIRK